MHKLFDLTGKTAIVTGGSGVLGRQHVAALRECGATVISVDIEQNADMCCDITKEKHVNRLSARVPRCDILINNAAYNGPAFVANRLEYLPLETWHESLSVGLTGAFLMSAVFGERMHKEGGGVIINIGSDLSLVAPDQRLYEGGAVKHAAYSVVKHGIIGLTKHLATYWPNVRCNALCPGSVESNQWDGGFKENLVKRIPMGRPAQMEEYKGAIVFLASDASSYMNGAVLTVDGGRTAW